MYRHPVYSPLSVLKSQPNSLFGAITAGLSRDSSAIGRRGRMRQCVLAFIGSPGGNVTMPKLWHRPGRIQAYIYDGWLVSNNHATRWLGALLKPLSGLKAFERMPPSQSMKRCHPKGALWSVHGHHGLGQLATCGLAETLECKHTLWLSCARCECSLTTLVWGAKGL